MGDIEIGKPGPWRVQPIWPKAQVASAAVIEILRFRLIEGADEAAFLVADKSVQEDFAYQQPGLLRRTTARSEGGEWVVIEVWESADAAERGALGREQDSAISRLRTFVDPSTVSSVRYTELD